MTNEQAKQAILGFTEFFKGITGNQDLKIPSEMAEKYGIEENMMTCEQCKYHSYIGNTHFCDSRNHKRRTVRISKDDAEKDMDCYWADEEGEQE